MTYKTCFGKFNWKNNKCKGCNVTTSCELLTNTKKPFPLKNDYIRRLRGDTSFCITIPRNPINKLKWEKGDLVEFKLKGDKLEMVRFE